MKNLVQIYLVTCAIVLTGCTTMKDRYSGSGGLLGDYYDSRDYNYVVRRANMYCSSIGMGAPRISKITNGCFMCPSGWDIYNFTCKPNIYNEPSTYSPPPTTPQRIAPIIQVKPLNLEDFKAQCKELGFKVGTPDFGNCVLELNDSK